MQQTHKVICEIPVAGIERLTTIDFPGYLAAVFFTRGCPWKCRYCHNSGLRTENYAGSMNLAEIEKFLDSRKGYLEGIVVSGGEPTMHVSLPDFLQIIREKGYKTALHTNGYYPDMLNTIIHGQLVDYIAMDVKAPPQIYDTITGVAGSCLPVSKSIRTIVSSGVLYEFRTTYHPLLISENDLLNAMKAIQSCGGKKYYLQRFRKDGVNDRELLDSCDEITIPPSAIALGEKLFDEFGIR